MVSNPVIKYGDTVTYKVGFAFFGNPMGPRTPNVTPADLKQEKLIPKSMQEMML